ncbi:endopeptidase La [Fontivita pretiosa]|uniref:endopeptidase La n=1 Tax=Fontivita pretiosa TaxID=2989684 RepID=UPI003D16D13B
MADSVILERSSDATVIRIGSNGQQLTIPNLLPILPIRNIVVFPGTVMPLNVGRQKSKNLLDEVMPGDKKIGIVTQRNPEVEDPKFEDLYHVGVAATILKLFKLPDGNQSIIVHGLVRFRLKGLVQTEPFAVGQIEVLEEIIRPGPELEALVASVRQQANRVIELSPNTPDEAAQVLNSITSPSALADFLAANVQGDVADKQAMLEELDVEKRLRMVASKLATQLDVLELQNKIQTQVKENIDKSQRRYYLQEQMKAIRKELGETEAGTAGEIEQLREKLIAAKLPENVMKEAERELARLEAIPSASPEYGVIRTYLTILSELPWSVTTPDKLDLEEARRILDRDHHDLEKVKRRILEYLAVLKLKQRARQAKSEKQAAEAGAAQPGQAAAKPSDNNQAINGSPGEENVGGAGAILCFVGPPGVGKTSLGKSIAEAMGRKFIRVALGGVRDEADIRGHRRTYIGSMPGRIIAEIRKAGTRNPVMMLDEIDKLGADFRGDPAAALLEVLDPAQNHTFTDHYLDVPFDLSKVLFIATANTMDTVPGPLRDRMEVIEIPGYTNTEKLHIAKKYLVPRQLEANGLTEKEARFKDEALREIIERYTREAGVRNLERNIGSIARAIAAEIVSGKVDHVVVDRQYVAKVLGPPKYESELAQRTRVPGVATGMAYTPYGGEILFIEATRMPGKGNILLTGQIGDVMKESATAAFSLIRSRAESLGIDPKLLAESDIHIHVPAGAVPKDGPSAGVAMFTALASLLLNRPVRPEVAMTGEITLRGLVLPIGGLKEKTLAAKRAGIKEVIVPKRNEKDLPDIPEEVRNTIKFHFVSTIDEVLDIALMPPSKSKAQKPEQKGPQTQEKAHKPENRAHKPEDKAHKPEERSEKKPVKARRRRPAAV